MSPEEADLRKPTGYNRTRRKLGGVYARHVEMATGLLVAALIGGLISWAKGVFDSPAQVRQLSAQMTEVIAGQATQQHQIDSLFRVSNGVVALQCLSLSDDAFAASRTLCGEAFHAARIISGEQVRNRRQR